MGNYYNNTTNINPADTKAGRRRMMNITLGRDPEDPTPIDWNFRFISRKERTSLRNRYPQIANY